MFLASLKILSCVAQSGFVFSNIFGIPGNLLSLMLPLLWAAFGVISWSAFGFLTLVVVSGEALEFLTGYFVGKKYGISNKSFWASIIGSIAFTILMAPLFLGLGAVLGAFIGAFAGTYAFELFTGEDKAVALRRGFASLGGKFVGTYLKIMIGFIAVGLTVKYLFT